PDSHCVSAEDRVQVGAAPAEVRVANINACIDLANGFAVLRIHDFCSAVFTRGQEQIAPANLNRDQRRLMFHDEPADLSGRYVEDMGGPVRRSGPERFAIWRKAEAGYGLGVFDWLIELLAEVAVVNADFAIRVTESQTPIVLADGAGGERAVLIGPTFNRRSVRDFPKKRVTRLPERKRQLIAGQNHRGHDRARMLDGGIEQLP